MCSCSVARENAITVKHEKKDPKPVENSQNVSSKTVDPLNKSASSEKKENKPAVALGDDEGLNGVLIRNISSKPAEGAKKEERKVSIPKLEQKPPAANVLERPSNDSSKPTPEPKVEERKVSVPREEHKASSKPHPENKPLDNKESAEKVESRVSVKPSPKDKSDDKKLTTPKEGNKVEAWLGEIYGSVQNKLLSNV
jgi:hypothetical protein